MSNIISAATLKKALKKKLPVDSNIIENNYQERKIVEIHRKIMKINDKRIILLKQIEVVDWIFGGTMFWKGKSFKTKVEATRFLKNAEDVWGQRMLKLTRPDLKTSGQWTTKLGEHLAEEIFIVLGNIKGEVKKVPVKKGLQPDGEADTFMFEAKTQLYYSTGTAAEKILGVPLKYRNVPDLYGKGVKIVCIGGAELRCVEFGLFPGTDNCMSCDPNEARRKMFKRYEEDFFGYVKGKLDVHKREFRVTFDQNETSKKCARIDGIIFRDGVVVCIEVDENGHQDYECDEHRMHLVTAELLQAYPDHVVSWVRVNPMVVAKNQWSKKSKKTREKRFDDVITKVLDIIETKNTSLVYIPGV